MLVKSMEDSKEGFWKQSYWVIIFILAAIVDIGIIIFSLVNQYDVILYVMVVMGVFGALGLNQIWNKDERTDEAIDLASRDVIRYFLVLIITLGIVFLIISSFTDPKFWIAGATLIISAIVLIYLQLVFAFYHERAMS